ncbi:MAG: 30S ribosomal protein S8 [candidate division WS6 bacterium GW2011_GWF2_39_15]|uniref:Small ribosomal subunit protein uS8 n=1 Tax=candidate division WS6 bacterium GW2011_GWF2_39_15 TaxID=1619100 RepID=A0A0G0MNM9_9BACT|nr:MAG: 30S ribosomal protein S8 [candidate division WS6 bacterium GW2011_GWF2_39_15]
MNDRISDLLARLQNGIIARKETINVPVTKGNKGVLDILKREEMINGYENDPEDVTMFRVTYMYTDGEPEVSKFVRISKPGLRKYVTAKDIKPVMNGRGISIISTSQGLMSGAVAKSKKLGGELICEIW